MCIVARTRVVRCMPIVRCMRIALRVRAVPCVSRARVGTVHFLFRVLGVSGLLGSLLAVPVFLRLRMRM
jgi:hypothetical protein